MNWVTVLVNLGSHNSYIGWFTEPTPFFTGGLSADEAKSALDEAMGDVMDVLSDMPPATGEWVSLMITPVTGYILLIHWVVYK